MDVVAAVVAVVADVVADCAEAVVAAALVEAWLGLALEAALDSAGDGVLDGTLSAAQLGAVPMDAVFDDAVGVALLVLSAVEGVVAPWGFDADGARPCAGTPVTGAGRATFPTAVAAPPLVGSIAQTVPPTRITAAATPTGTRARVGAGIEVGIGVRADVGAGAGAEVGNSSLPAASVPLCQTKSCRECDADGFARR